MAPNAGLSTHDAACIESGSLTCQICLEEFSQMVQKPVTRFCSATCPAVMCTPCVERHLQVAMEVPYSGALPKIRCPLCLVSVNKQRWVRCLDSNAATTALLVQQYSKLCEESCNFTCPGCHNPHYTQLPDFYEGSSKVDLANASTLTLRPSEKTRIPELRRVIRRFCRHSRTTTARDVIRYITDNFPASNTNCIIHKVLQRILDEERRATLLLAYHSVHRRVVTRCCGSFACFNCKRAVYDAETPCVCEAEDLDVISDEDIIECRSCRVMLVKVDGCSSVWCVCGYSMSWTDEQRIKNLHQRKLLPVDPFDMTLYDHWVTWVYMFQSATGADALLLRQSAILHALNSSHPAFRETLRRLIWKKRFRKVITGAELELRRKFVLRSHPVVKEALRTLVWRRRRFHRKVMEECRVAFVVHTAHRQAELMKPILLKFMWYARFRYRVLGSLLRRVYCISKGWGDLTEEQQETEEEQLAFLSIGLN